MSRDCLDTQDSRMWPSASGRCEGPTRRSSPRDPIPASVGDSAETAPSPGWSRDLRRSCSARTARLPAAEASVRVIQSPISSNSRCTVAPGVSAPAAQRECRGPCRGGTLLSLAQARQRRIVGLAVAAPSPDDTAVPTNRAFGEPQRGARRIRSLWTRHRDAHPSCAASSVPVSRTDGTRLAASSILACLTRARRRRSFRYRPCTPSSALPWISDRR